MRGRTGKSKPSSYNEVHGTGAVFGDVTIASPAFVPGITTPRMIYRRGSQNSIWHACQNCAGWPMELPGINAPSMVSADSTIKVRGLSLVSRLTGDPEDDEEEEEEKKKSEEDEDDEEDDGEEEEETWQVMRYG